MSDSLAVEPVDVSKLKVVDLRKELKSRGLAHTGDKAELVARLQAAVAEENEEASESHDEADITLDSDEIDSDFVLDDDGSLNRTVDEELALAENPPIEKKSLTPPKSDTPPELKKRKLTSSDPDSAKPSDNKVARGKKIILKRVPVSAPMVEAVDKVGPIKVTEDKDSNAGNKTLVTQSRLKMRAERFGLPVKMTEEERKAARMARFNRDSSTITSDKTEPLGENLEKLKKRAERFGQNVSKVMSEIEMKERLEKRKQKFGSVK